MLRPCPNTRVGAKPPFRSASRRSKSNGSPRPKKNPAPAVCWPPIITWAMSAPSASNSGMPSPTPAATGWACWSFAPLRAGCARGTGGSAGPMSNAASSSPARQQLPLPAPARQNLSQPRLPFAAPLPGAPVGRLADPLRPSRRAGGNVRGPRTLLRHRL